MNIARLLKLGLIKKEHFLAAVDQLTCIPVPGVDRSSKTTAYAVLAYPAVGLCIGLLILVLMLLLSSSEVAVVAVLGLMIGIVSTQGLHINHLAIAVKDWQQKPNATDAQDAQAVTILIYVMVLLLLMKFAALMALLGSQEWGVILMAPILGRSVLILFALSTPDVRDPASIEQFKNLPRMRARVMLGVVGLASLVLLGGDIWGVFIVMLALLYFVRHHAIKRYGGVTTNIKSGMVELVETLTLFIACL